MQDTKSQSTVADVKIENTALKQETAKEYFFINRTRKSSMVLEEPYSPTLSCFNFNHSSLINNYKSAGCSLSNPTDSPDSKEVSIAEEIPDATWPNMKALNDEFAQKIEEFMQPFETQKPKNRVTTLTQMITEELEDVSDDIFFDAKWKIIDILREAQAKQRVQQAPVLPNGLNIPTGRVRTLSASSSSSSSVIIVPSPIRFPVYPELNSSTPQKYVNSKALSSKSSTCPLISKSTQTNPSKSVTFRGKIRNSASAGS